MNLTRIMSENDLEVAFAIRKEVFVEKQGVPLVDEFDEFDKLNGLSEHVLVYHRAEPVGTGRIRWVVGRGKLERICILEPFRKLGLGKVIISALEEIAEEKEVTQVKLHAQTHAEDFYKKLGYQTSSNIFMEDGIPHILMMKELLTQ